MLTAGGCHLKLPIGASPPGLERVALPDAEAQRRRRNAGRRPGFPVLAATHRACRQRAPDRHAVSAIGTAELPARRLSRVQRAVRSGDCNAHPTTPVIELSSLKARLAGVRQRALPRTGGSGLRRCGWMVDDSRDVLGGENRAAQGRREGQYRRDIGPTEDKLQGERLAAVTGRPATQAGLPWRRRFAAAAPPQHGGRPQTDGQARGGMGSLI